MRLLCIRTHVVWEGVYRSATECDRGGDYAGLEGITLPLLRPHSHSASASALRQGERMKPQNVHAAASRRDFLRGAGALIVSFSMGGGSARLAAQSPINPTGLVDATQVDSWISIGADESITVYTGK